MKYILMCTAAMIVCFGIGTVLAYLVRKKLRGKHLRLKTAAMAVLFGVLLCVGVTFGYLSIYYHADDVAVTAANTEETVKMTAITGGYFFDGPGDTAAMVFYPGAKVDTIAYAPLMTRVAEQGVDCFLADVPFHMAMFGSNLAGTFMDSYDYDTWATAGHSMGGIIAAQYAEKHPGEVQAVVLLASYPTVMLPESTALLSVYGTNDGCLDCAQYEKHRDLWPENSKEVVIDGGNHAQFGSYGDQKGDGISEIDPEEQRRITAEQICDVLLSAE